MTGYDADFLQGTALAVPVAPGIADTDRLDYVHFSLVMNPARGLAWWVAWNIDGTRLFPDVPRESTFYPDERIPARDQTLEDVDAGNDLDRGHLARPSDLLWGTYDEAKATNHDSFCFTNITPQINTFNQASRGGIWGELENAVLALEGLSDRRVSVFAGPVLTDDDPTTGDWSKSPLSTGRSSFTASTTRPDSDASSSHNLSPTWAPASSMPCHLPGRPHSPEPALSRRVPRPGGAARRSNRKPAHGTEDPPTATQCHRCQLVNRAEAAAKSD